MDIWYAISILLALMLGTLLVRRRKRRQKAELALRALFEPGSDFIGKDIEYVVSKAGPYTFFGSMDHGREVAQWKAGRLVAEVWLQSGACTEVQVR
ncbi:hypothetical protein QFW77_02650 [Luteimonas sp. RD2P54]|uniref:Uncharacterized protein n=1 Tax=Luteimonas endophytica TaxID=3042023 RepID=A0ABT6J514_9GAMM|nr:hypothetical protein [Luteimonas endophytica]MDH5821895.1 hypothetical protein [Luteimonas endophytica]